MNSIIITKHYQLLLFHIIIFCYPSTEYFQLNIISQQLSGWLLRSLSAGYNNQLIKVRRRLTTDEFVLVFLHSPMTDDLRWWVYVTWHFTISIPNSDSSIRKSWCNRTTLFDCTYQLCFSVEYLEAWNNNKI